LPPPSATAQEAAEAALRRRAEAAEQAVKDAEAATKRLELELAAKVAADELAAKQRPADPERIWGVPVRNALIAFMAAVTALGAPATIWLTAQAEIAKQEAAQLKIATAALQAKATEEQANKAKAKVELADSKSELVAQRVYYREVFRIMGVEIPKHPGDPDPPDLKPVTPLCPTGKVCSGPQLIISVPP
jgi:hypothetical protein